MKTDKALYKLLKQRPDDLSMSFESRVMRQIALEAVRQKRRSYIRGLVLVSFVCIVLTAGAVLLLEAFFPGGVSNLLHFFRLPGRQAFVSDFQNFLAPGNRFILWFSLYIGALIVLLLGLDRGFRNWMRKTGRL